MTLSGLELGLGPSGYPKSTDMLEQVGPGPHTNRKPQSRQVINIQTYKIWRKGSEPSKISMFSTWPKNHCSGSRHQHFAFPGFGYKSANYTLIYAVTIRMFKHLPSCKFYPYVSTLRMRSNNILILLKILLHVQITAFANNSRKPSCKFYLYVNILSMCSNNIWIY